MGRILVALAAIALVFFFWSEAAAYPRTAARLPNLLGWIVLILAPGEGSRHAGAHPALRVA